MITHSSFCNESVVINHGIVTANIRTISHITIILQLKKAGQI